MKKLVIVTMLAAVLGFSTLANAALQDLGNGIILDTDINLMWLKNATGYNYMGWENAKAYAESQTVGGYDDWRLPSAGEMEHLFNVEDIRGSYGSSPPFVNLWPEIYWTGTEADPTHAYAFQWGATTEPNLAYVPNGVDGPPNHNEGMHPWAARAVPVPGSVLLMGSGLAGFLAWGWRRRQG